VKANSSELLTKQAMRIQLLRVSTRNTYVHTYIHMCILKLLLNLITTRIGALGLKNKSLYAFVKEVCHV
jgi:hypothetical protein